MWSRNCFPLRNICVTNDHEYVLRVVNTSRSFPNSWLITGFVTRVTRLVSLVQQDCPLFRSTWVHHRLLVAGSVVSRVMFCRLLFVVCSVVLCHWAIVLSVLRYTASGYPFGIFKTFLWQFMHCNNQGHLKEFNYRTPSGRSLFSSPFIRRLNDIPNSTWYDTTYMPRRWGLSKSLL
jgi:hypothetical protein